MNAQDILDLLRGGYTKAEIDALMNGQSAQADPSPGHGADPDLGIDPEPTPAADPAPNPGSDADKPEWASALEASITALTKTMQSNALMNDEQPDEPSSAADSALADYITGGKSRRAK